MTGLGAKRCAVHDLALPLLCGALLGLGLAASAAPGTGGRKPAARPPIVELPEGPLWQQHLDVAADDVDLEELVLKTGKQYNLPLGVGERLRAEKTRPRLTLRMRDASTESALTAIAVCMGDGCRWRRDGEGLALERDPKARTVTAEGRRPDAVPLATAEALRSSLAMAGLVAGPEAANGVPPAFLEGWALRTSGQARDLATWLAGAFPPGTLVPGPQGGGVPVGALPPETQQLVFDIVAHGLRGPVLLGAVNDAYRLIGSPLVSGRDPVSIRVRRQPGGEWCVDYDVGFPIPSSPGGGHGQNIGSFPLRVPGE